VNSLFAPYHLIVNNYPEVIPEFPYTSMHNINITNLSDHDHKFEVHGWNNKSNMTVQAHTTAAIQTEDGTSGAIIALHDGHEGEQAETTKNGFGGSDVPRPFLGFQR